MAFGFKTLFNAKEEAGQGPIADPITPKGLSTLSPEVGQLHFSHFPYGKTETEKTAKSKATLW